MVDMKKEIEACQRKKRPDEIMVFAFLGDRASTHIETTVPVLKMLKEHKGFLGVHITGILLPLYIFDTLENAIDAKFKAEDIIKRFQGEVRPVLVEKKYLEGSSKE